VYFIIARARSTTQTKFPASTHAVRIVDDVLPRAQVVAFGIEHDERVDVVVAVEHVDVTLQVVGHHRDPAEVPPLGHRLPRAFLASHPDGRLYPESQVDLHAQESALVSVPRFADPSLVGGLRGQSGRMRGLCSGSARSATAATSLLLCHDGHRRGKADE
jgi:hypothetical protein